MQEILSYLSSLVKVPLVLTGLLNLKGEEAIVGPLDPLPGDPAAPGLPAAAVLLALLHSETLGVEVEAQSILVRPDQHHLLPLVLAQ